jgi:hypothetical protein
MSVIPTMGGGGRRIASSRLASLSLKNNNNL